MPGQTVGDRAHSRTAPSAAPRRAGVRGLLRNLEALQRSIGNQGVVQLLRERAATATVQRAGGVGVEAEIGSFSDRLKFFQGLGGGSGAQGTDETQAPGEQPVTEQVVEPDAPVASQDERARELVRQQVKEYDGWSSIFEFADNDVYRIEGEEGLAGRMFGPEAVERFHENRAEYQIANDVSEKLGMTGDAADDWVHEWAPKVLQEARLEAYNRFKAMEHPPGQASGKDAPGGGVSGFATMTEDDMLAERAERRKVVEENQTRIGLLETELAKRHDMLGGKELGRALAN